MAGGKLKNVAKGCLIFNMQERMPILPDITVYLKKIMLRIFLVCNAGQS